MATLERYRRRDTGAVVQARRATSHETVAHGTVWREVRDPETNAVLTDALGRPLRRADGQHEVELNEGQWLIVQGDAVSVMEDAGFRVWAVPVDAMSPVHLLGTAYHQKMEDEANAAVALGKRFKELDGAGGEPKDGLEHAERVQLHAAVVHHYNGRDDLALELLKQPAMEAKGHPETIEDLMVHALDYVDGTTLTALEADQQRRESTRLLTQALGEE